MRRAFQITLLTAAFIPFLLGAMSLIQGAKRLVPAELISAELDGQVRFWGVRSMLPFVLAVWIVCNIGRSYAVLVIVLGATAAGGLARAVGAFKYGGTEPALVGIIAFEVAVLLFIPWYRQVARQSAVERAP